MTTPDSGTAQLLTATSIPVQVKLAALWTSFMFFYAYVDILGIYTPGVVKDILAGVVWEFQITQVWAVSALGLMAIPILMIVLCTMLPARANRITNLAVASFYALVSVGNGIGESWTYYYGLAIGLELAVLALIFRLAWMWRVVAREGRAQTRDVSVEHRQG